MIHINRSKDKKFYVTVVGENGECLSTSETLNSKQAAWKNIAAIAKAFNLDSVLVNDKSYKIAMKRYRLDLPANKKIELW